MNPSLPNLFDLPLTVPTGLDAKLWLIPVPWEGTVSYGGGTADGPSAICRASVQVDLFDAEYGDLYTPGIFLQPEDPEILQWNQNAKENHSPAHVNPLSKQLNQRVYEKSFTALQKDRIVGLLGGEHSVSYGAFRAVQEKHGSFGILHFDAHHDLRDAYQGFQHSHASIFHNALEDFSGISKLVSVGIRDFSREEQAYAKSQNSRVRTYYDREIQSLLHSGIHWNTIAEEMIQQLPDQVWISFDIDGLDPTLCPSTGTPVPGGLLWNQATSLLARLSKSGKKILGFDLVEVSPRVDSEWDANIGARLLYQLCGATFRSQKLN